MGYGAPRFRNVGDPLLPDAYFVDMTGPLIVATRPTTVAARCQLTAPAQVIARAAGVADRAEPDITAEPKIAATVAEPAIAAMIEDFRSRTRSLSVVDI